MKPSFYLNFVCKRYGHYQVLLLDGSRNVVNVKKTLYLLWFNF
jgi:hypothetical protein